MKRIKTDVKDTDVKITLKGSEGGIMIGTVSEFDMMDDYGSAASADYRPYIVSPKMRTETSRLLFNRMKKTIGSSYFVAPVGETRLSELIDITLKFNKSDISNTTKPALLFWNNVKEEWQLIEEDCFLHEVINLSEETYTAKLCLPANTSLPLQRKKRSLGIPIQGPRQFVLQVIDKAVAQSAPKLTYNTISFKEDNINCSLCLEYIDNEGDKVNFQLIRQPANGFINITRDGCICFAPEENFSGRDTLIVQLLEKDLPKGAVAVPQDVELEIIVEDVNDPPELYFVRGNKTFKALDWHQNITIRLEANTTDYVLGTLIAHDVDARDSLTYRQLFSMETKATFSLKQIKESEVEIPDTLSVSTDLLIFELSIAFPKQFHDVLTYSFMVFDKQHIPSPPISLEIGVLVSPCVHGHCAQTSPNEPSCNDLERAQTFNNFQCSCQPGYEGVWCDIEINECQEQPCPLMYDCEDLIARYKCNINIAKLMAILVCIVVALALVSFLIYRKKKLMKERAKVSDIWNMSSRTDLLSSYPSREEKNWKYSGFIDQEESSDAPDKQPENNSETEASKMEEKEDADPDTNIWNFSILPSIGTVRPPHHTAHKQSGGILKLQNGEITPINV